MREGSEGDLGGGRLERALRSGREKKRKYVERKCRGQRDAARLGGEAAQVEVVLDVVLVDLDEELVAAEGAEPGDPGAHLGGSGWWVVGGELSWWR